VLLAAFLLVSGGVYAALVWYPERAADQLMRPTSEEFAGALEAYRATVSAFPPGPTDPQALVDASNAVLTTAPETRERLTTSATELTNRNPPDIPVISSRSPLGEARALREQIIAFYTQALDVVGRTEASAGYLTQAAAVLPQLDTLATTLGNPEEPGEVRAAVAAATPVADQMLADLRALTPPSELAGLHTSLQAIARRIRDDLDEAARTAQTGAAPVVTALLEAIGGTMETFRETLGRAPREVARAGVAAAAGQVDALARQIVAKLHALRDVHGLTDVTVPGA
jgi:hypothetical protein